MIRSIACLLVLLPLLAFAGNTSVTASLKGSVVGASPDGTKYVWRSVGVPELGSMVESPCRYPALPEEPTPAEITLYLCEVRGECQGFPIYDFPSGDTDDLDASKCTPAAVAAQRLEEAKKAFASAGVDLNKPGTALAVAWRKPPKDRADYVCENGARVTIPRQAMAIVGIDADVVLSAGNPGNSNSLYAEAVGFPRVRLQGLRGGYADTIHSPWLSPDGTWFISRSCLYRGWHVGKVDIPLARIAVRLLFGRAERTAKSDPKGAREDLRRALQLDPTFEKAASLLATLK